MQSLVDLFVLSCCSLPGGQTICLSPGDKHFSHTAGGGQTQHTSEGGHRALYVWGDKQPMCEVGDEQPLYWEEDQMWLLGPRMGEAHPLGAEGPPWGQSPQPRIRGA